MERDSFYSLIRSGQPENCMIALEIANALAAEDRFFADFKIAIDVAMNYAITEFYGDIIEFLCHLGSGQLNVADFKEDAIPSEWYTIAELVDRLNFDYFGGDRMPSGFNIFKKTKELNVYLRSNALVGEEVEGMYALEKYSAASKNELKISPKIALTKSIKALDFYSEADDIYIPEAIEKISTLETLKLKSSFEGILLKKLSLKNLQLNLIVPKKKAHKESSTIKRLVEEDSLPPMLEQLCINFYGVENLGTFIRDKVFSLKNLSYLHLHTSDGISLEIGKELSGMKKLKNVNLSRLKKEDLICFSELPELETITITCDHQEEEVEAMQEYLLKKGSKVKVILEELPF